MATKLMLADPEHRKGKTMDRTDVVVAIDHSCDGLEQAMAILNGLGATYSMVNRVQNLIDQLEVLRIDVMQCNLLIEEIVK